jgi:hypothetical protein
VPERSTTSKDPSIAPGVWVEVRNAFNGCWSPGFVVEEVTERGCRLRRVRDGLVLPDPVPRRDVRAIPTVRSTPTWRRKAPGP